MRAPAIAADPPQADWNETQVQPFQAAALLGGLRATEGIEGCVAEIGAWRGVTTRTLALAAGGSKVVAVDRWVRAKEDRNYEAFLRRTEGLPNVAHERLHSGGGQRLVAWSDSICDAPEFAGCRLAIFQVADQFELFAHVPGLALLRIRPQLGAGHYSRTRTIFSTSGRRRRARMTRARCWRLATSSTNSMGA